MMDSPPLRLGVWCAVLRDGDLLLSQRSDLNVWALPGGRLDEGESLAEAAAREVEEETGLAVRDVRPAGLYYLAGWQRLNVLFTANAAGGALMSRTSETRDNCFFPAQALPKMPLRRPAEDAATGETGQLCVLRTTAARRLQLRLRFGWRYFENWLRGQPEPDFPRFTVSAAALITHAPDGRLLTISGEQTAAGQLRALPRLEVGGELPPWEALDAQLAAAYGLHVTLRWVGLWQDVAAGALELVFAGQTDAAGSGHWSSTRLTALDDRDAAYLARASAAAPIWSLEANSGATHDRALPARADAQNTA